MKTEIRILAVDDPAVCVYTDPRFRIIEDYPDPSVSIVFDVISWERYYDTMLQTFRGAQSYDIVMVAGHLWLADFAEKGYLEPLAYAFEDIVPMIAREMCYEGVSYLSPSFCDGHMLVYRKSLVEEATGGALKDVLTVEELLSTAKALRDKGNPCPVVLKAHPSEILLDALPYLRSGGEELYSLRNGRVTCHIDEMAEGMEKYLSMKALAPSDTNTYGNKEVKDAIATQGSAMAVTWSGQLGVVMEACSTPEDLGFATLDTAWNVTWSFGISSASDNKEKARDVLAYFRSAAVDEAVGGYCGAPVRRRTYIEGAEKYPWYPVQLKMIENWAKPLISMARAGEANAILYDAVYRAFTGEQDVKTAFGQAKEAVEALF